MRPPGASATVLTVPEGVETARVTRPRRTSRTIHGGHRRACVVLFAAKPSETAGFTVKQLAKLDWRSLSAELFVVFIGLFAALQLDDWRQDREFRESETRNLVRLRQDLEGFLEFSSNVLPFLERNYDAVRHVSDSLAAGRILDDDTRKFEIGLIYVGHLPSLMVQRSAYDEMVASGMFARLRSESLKRQISRLYATEAVIDKNFSWWRNSVGELETRLYSRVRYYSEDKLDPVASHMAVNEPVRRVEFDFDELREDPSIRSGFYWATDTHSDWVHWTRGLKEMAERTSAMLDEELATR